MHVFFRRALLLLAFAAPAAAQTQADLQYQPYVGQAGKDVVWVPTPPELVEKMLDMARVTPRDFVMDLGSGDGRNIIAAAKRGARALGVEYNAEMVVLAERAAAAARVSDKAKFVRGDMYEADISKASVLALFLLPDNLRKLTPKFLAMRPGSRIVVNGFPIPGWDHHETGTIEGTCTSWCTAYLYIVPARVAGSWRLPAGELRLEQSFTTVSGTLSSGGVSRTVQGQVSGNRISFTIDGTRYSGQVKGNTISGTNGDQAARFIATRART